MALVNCEYVSMSSETLTSGLDDIEFQSNQSLLQAYPNGYTFYIHPKDGYVLQASDFTDYTSETNTDSFGWLDQIEITLSLIHI